MEEALSMLADLDDPRVPMEKAELLQALGRDNEAEVLFRRMILATDVEQRSAGRVGLGRTLLERGDAAGALAALDQEAVDPGYALTAAEVRGESLLALGRVAEAQAVYAALDGDAEARVVRALGLGDCALAAENPVEARSQFEAALSSADRFYQAQALAGLVRTAAEAGDPAKAGELLQKLRSEYPDHEDAIAAARAGISGQ
jgi:predicted negative regulator of RcsB-dependent stress response